MQTEKHSSPAVTFDGVYNVRSFGAVGDGISKDTAYLQSAIDACEQAGGGTVLVPPGRYLSGTLFLASHLTLHLSAGAILLGSKDIADYPSNIMGFRDAVGTDRGQSLLLAYQKENVTIEGHGTIDGQGKGYRDPRPMILRFLECKRVTVTEITLKDSAAWVQHYLQCEDVMVRGVRVVSHSNGNNDGINIDGCSRVVVSDCHFSCEDDAFTLKCTTKKPCRDIVVTNCLFQSNCNGIKFGTESIGGFENVTISNCVVYDTRLCGITVATVDGAFLRDVLIHNITMRNVGGALFVRLGSRGYHMSHDIKTRPVGHLQRLTIRDVQATNVDRIGSAIIGMPGHPIEDVTLENISIISAGGCAEAEVNRVWVEKPACYPQYDHWGLFPAYGLYCRHVRGLRLAHLKFEATAADARPALLCHEVNDFIAQKVTANGERTENGRPTNPTVLATRIFEANGCSV